MIYRETYIPPQGWVLSIGVRSITQFLGCTELAYNEGSP